MHLLRVGIKVSCRQSARSYQHSRASRSLGPDMRLKDVHADYGGEVGSLVIIQFSMAFSRLILIIVIRTTVKVKASFVVVVRARKGGNFSSLADAKN